MRALLTLFVLMTVSPSCAADATIKDADTLILEGTEFRLDGVDSPEKDQVCLDEHGAIWPCGIKARDALAKAIAGRAVRCEDKGPDPVHPKRRIGICSVEGEAVSLNQWLVRTGWALNFEPYARGRFKADEAEARDQQLGLWKGCFSDPQDLRRWTKSTARLLGCANGHQADARNKLFPDHPAMRPGCSIKGKIGLRAQVTSDRGIYHMEGCRSYASTKKPNRWFCSEDEALAAGFRKSYRC